MRRSFHSSFLTIPGYTPLNIATKASKAAAKKRSEKAKKKRKKG